MSSRQVQSDYDQLAGLLCRFGDLNSFLDSLTVLGSDVMTEITGARVECAVTLQRRKRPTTIAGSSEIAVRLDQIEQSNGGGPCMQALKTGSPVLLADIASDPRWPGYCRALAAAGYNSTLGLPLSPGENATAALNFFAPPLRPHQRINDPQSNRLRRISRAGAGSGRQDGGKG